MANYLFGQNLVAPSVVQKIAYPAVSGNLQLVWPTALTNDPNVFAIINEVQTTGAVGDQISLPPANQVGVGQQGMILNLGEKDFIVFDYFSVNALTTIKTGQAVLFWVTNNTQASGSPGVTVWNNIVYGAGTSAADASALAGFGLYAGQNIIDPGITLNTFYNVEVLGPGITTVSYLQQSSLLVANTNVTSIILPIQVDYYVAINNIGTTVIPITTSPAALINGSATPLNLLAGQNAIFVCDGTNYYTLGLPAMNLPTPGTLRLGRQVVKTAPFTIAANDNPVSIFTEAFTPTTFNKPLIVQAAITIQPPQASTYAAGIAGGGCIVTLANINSGASVSQSFGQLYSPNDVFITDLVLIDTSPAITGTLNYTVTVINSTSSATAASVNVAPGETIGVSGFKSTFMIYEVA